MITRLLIAIVILFPCKSYSQLTDLLTNKLQNSKLVEYEAKSWSHKVGTNDTTFRLGTHMIGFTLNDSICNALFKFDSETRTEIYDGHEYIVIDKKKKDATIFNFSEVPDQGAKIVSYANSYIEILQLLNQTKTENTFIISKSKNEIILTGKDYSYKGRVPKSSGTSTIIKIILNKTTLLPESLNIQIFNMGQLSRDWGTYFTNVKSYPNENQAIFSIENLDPKFDIVHHKYLTNLKVGDKIPNWSVYPIKSDKKILLRDLYKEDILLIEFWFTQCHYCIESIPTLNTLYKQYQNQGFKVLYINGLMTDTDEAIESFSKTHQIQFDIFKFGNFFDHGSFPTFILVDRQGVILYKTDGYPDKLINDIEKFIKK